MLKKENFTLEHVNALRERYQRDPLLLERTVYACGLLEALARVGLPFVFKGGTCLMFLIKTPRRLSTDIDIVVAPGTEVESFIEKAQGIFPFVTSIEQIRQRRGVIEKRHFKFSYDSPVMGRSSYILLDILFEDTHYANIVERPIESDLLLAEGESLKVRIPNVDSILGDKLTAFAPHTIGIPLGMDKDMEIIKQFFDVAMLLDSMEDFSAVRKTYYAVASREIAYRGLAVSPEETLADTYESALCIATRGRTSPGDYRAYVRGCRSVSGHVFSENYSTEVAALQAVKVMYAVQCLIMSRSFVSVSDPDQYFDAKLSHPEILKLRNFRDRSREAFAYLVLLDRMFAEEG